MTDTPVDPKTVPHKELDAVIDWIGIGYEMHVVRKSDGKPIIISVREDKSSTNEVHNE